MIPVRLYRNRLIAGGNWVGAANGAISMAVVGFLPVYMQGLMGCQHVDVGPGARNHVGALANWRLRRQPPRASHVLSSVVRDWRRHSRDWKHIARIAPSRRQSVAADRCGGDHGSGHGHHEYLLRGRDPVQRRLVSSRRGDVESVLLPHYRSVVRQRRIRRHIQCGTGKSGGRSTATSSFTCSRRGTQRIANIPGIQGVLDALAHALHSIYLLSGLIAVLVLAAVLTFPAGLKLLKEH